MEEMDRRLRESPLLRERVLIGAEGPQLEVKGDTVVNCTKKDGTDTVAVLSAA